MRWKRKKASIDNKAEERGGGEGEEKRKLKRMMEGKRRVRRGMTAQVVR